MILLAFEVGKYYLSSNKYNTPLGEYRFQHQVLNILSWEGGVIISKENFTFKAYRISLTNNNNNFNISTS